jgi:hypothetical protein
MEKIFSIFSEGIKKLLRTINPERILASIGHETKN